MKTVISFFVFIIGISISVDSFCQNMSKQNSVLLTKAKFIWSDNVWDLVSYMVFDYNDIGQIILSNSYELTSSGLYNNSKDVFEYYENNDSLKYHYYYESLMGVGFDSYGLDKFYYDDSLRLSEQINSYNLDGSQTIYFRSTFEYNDYLLSYKNIFTGTPDNWDLLKVFNYFYDNQESVNGYVMFKNEDTSLVKSDSVYYNYDSYGNILKKEFFIWENEYWERYKQHLYIYSEDFNESEEIFQQWQDSIWINISMTTSWYDEDGLITEKVNMKWEDTSWVNKERWLYFYGVLGEENEVEENQSVTLYPNPNSGKFYIDFTNNLVEYSIFVFNSNGKLLLSIESNNSKKVPIDISSRPSGFYFIKVMTDSKVFVKKVMVR